MKLMAVAQTIVAKQQRNPQTNSANGTFTLQHFSFILFFTLCS